MTDMNNLASLGLKSLSIILGCWLCSPAVAGEKCRRVVYSAHSSYPPFHWQDQGKIIGASHDITQLILNELKIPSESHAIGPWKRVLHSARLGQIDLVLGLKQTAERENYLAFTDHLLVANPVAVFVARDRPFHFEQWSDLIGKRGNMNLGDRHGEPFDHFAETNLSIRRVAGLKSNFKMLINNRTDYFITGLQTGRAYLATSKYQHKINHLANHVIAGQIHHGFSTRSPCRQLIPYFNKRFKELQQDGSIAAIVEKNLQIWKTTHHQHEH